jgi:hypothetical protein
MSLSPTVALVAAGLAVAGGTSYVSLMHGALDSSAVDTPWVLDDAASAGSVDQFSPYLEATFASLKPRAVTEITASTASIGPPLTFASRFAGLTTDGLGVASAAAPRGQPSARVANPKIAAPKITGPNTTGPNTTRTIAVRMDNRAPAAAEPKPFQVASYAPTRDDTLTTEPFTFRSDIRVPPMQQAMTTLAPFDSAPFPFDGGSTKRFYNVSDEGRRGHRTFRGRVIWEKDAYSDPRVLLHIPKGFDVNKPSVMVVFFHGHGATLTRDVLTRQQVPAQISEAGANAVLVAPQLAFDARDSSPGKLWEPGAFARFIREAGEQLTRLYGDPRVGRTFANMPIIVVAYSGGYLTAASSLSRGGLKNRVRGVVLLDALYGELDKFASWINTNRSGFFVSAYTRSTQRRNAELEHMLSERDVTFGTALKSNNRLDGSVTFLQAREDVRHRDFVNHAWGDMPIRDILSRLPEYRL